MIIETIIGRKGIDLIVSEKLAAIILKTNKEVNSKKRVAQMRRCYYGEINDTPILFSPTFIYAFEEKLDEEQYFNAFHNEFFNCPRSEMAIYCSLFREGRTISYVRKKFGLNTYVIEEKIQKLFTALSEKIKYAHEEIIVE